MTDTETQGRSKPTFRLVGLNKAEDSIQNNLTRTKEGDVPDSVVQGNAFEKEDEYQSLYVGGANDKGILEPPYKLRVLDRLVQENNALLPCTEAMVTNIAKTGYDFEREGEDVETDADDGKIKELRDFFLEPWTGESWTSIYEKLERDLHRVGNAYLEVLTNANDEIVFVRHVDAKMMRMVKLDDAIPVEKVIRRRGVEQKVTVMQRERRFAQLLHGTTLMYFREFGTSRDVHKKTGAWAAKGQRLPAKDRGTQIIHFAALPDAHTPYGVPYWINQLPSVLGSRKAEEFNLEFFDNGGVPPAMIILQGGAMQAETRKAIEQKASLGSAATKNRIQVLEVEPTGGSMDHPGQARVTVERFGGERTSDSMFEEYDDRCEQRVRRSFRMPPIFVGKADDYSFATAFASYTVAEAQVFKPERDKFDEIITMRLLKAMGYAGYKFVSKPLVIEDAALKLTGIELAITTGRVDPEDVIYEINEASGTNLKVSEAPTHAPGSTLTVDEEGNVVPVMEPQPVPFMGHNGGPPLDDKKPAGAAKSQPKTAPTPGKVAKGELRGVLALAEETLRALRERDLVTLQKNLTMVNSLDEKGLTELRKATTMLQFVDPHNDVEGLSDLMGCTFNVMLNQPRAINCN